MVEGYLQTGRKPQPRAVVENALQPADRTSWGETHPALHLHPDLPGEKPDTSLLPMAVADLPEDFTAHGGTLHFLITKPEWTVLDDKGQAFQPADEVVVTVSDPDQGIGLEFDRLEINPHQKPADRRWRAFDVKIPECTRRILVEVLRGSRPESNPYFDHVYLNVREAVVFKKERPHGPDANLTCPEMMLRQECPKPELPPQCANRPA